MMAFRCLLTTFEINNMNTSEQRDVRELDRFFVMQNVFLFIILMCRIDEFKTILKRVKYFCIAKFVRADPFEKLKLESCCF